MNKITINIINSLLAGSLVLLGACSDGLPSFQSFFLALIAAAIVAISQFKDFWVENEVKSKLNKTRVMNFLNI